MVIKAVGKPGACCCDPEPFVVRWIDFVRRADEFDLDDQTSFDWVFGRDFNSSAFTGFATARIDLTFQNVGASNRIYTMRVSNLVILPSNFTFVRMEGHPTKGEFNPIATTEGTEIIFSTDPEPGMWALHVRLLFLNESDELTAVGLIAASEGQFGRI